MKYLNRFDESSQLFKLMNRQDLDEFNLRGKVGSPFTKVELDTLINFEYFKFLWMKEYQVIMRNSKLEIEIIKLDDEWFYVGEYNTHKQFKCDTFDGVIQLLNKYQKKYV